jgi:hypothetical protein
MNTHRKPYASLICQLICQFDVPVWCLRSVVCVLSLNNTLHHQRTHRLAAHHNAAWFGFRQDICVLNWCVENGLRTNAWRKVAVRGVRRTQACGHQLGTDLATFVHTLANKFIAP